MDALRADPKSDEYTYRELKRQKKATKHITTQDRLLFIHFLQGSNNHRKLLPVELDPPKEMMGDAGFEPATSTV